MLHLFCNGILDGLGQIRRMSCEHVLHVRHLRAALHNARAQLLRWTEVATGVCPPDSNLELIQLCQAHRSRILQDVEINSLCAGRGREGTMVAPVSCERIVAINPLEAERGL